MIYQYKNFIVESADPVAALKEAYRLLVDEWNATHSTAEISGYTTTPGTGDTPVAVEALVYANQEIARVMQLDTREPGLPVENASAGNGMLWLGLLLVAGFFAFNRKKR